MSFSANQGMCGLHTVEEETLNEEKRFRVDVWQVDLRMMEAVKMKIFDRSLTCWFWNVCCS